MSENNFEEWFESSGFGGDMWSDFRKCFSQVQELKQALQKEKEKNAVLTQKSRDYEKALKYYEALETCRSYECCGGCGDSYTAEEVLEKHESEASPSSDDSKGGVE